MRKSVLTGIFACTLFFGMGTSHASALNQEKSDEKTVVAMLSATDNVTALQVLETVTNVDDTETPTEPAVIKHVVAENETLSIIAKTYGTTWLRLFYKNINIEDPNIISQGMELVVPDATEELAERPLPTPKPIVLAAKTNSTQATSTASSPAPQPVSVAGNRYSAGYCTWYVKNRRPDLPNNLGDARTWVSRAAAQGMSTGTTPVAGAVGQRGNHVVYVESVNGDGTVTVSEMNHKGWNVTSTRTVAADYFTYIY